MSSPAKLLCLIMPRTLQQGSHCLPIWGCSCSTHIRHSRLHASVKSRLWGQCPHRRPHDVLCEGVQHPQSHVLLTGFGSPGQGTRSCSRPPANCRTTVRQARACVRPSRYPFAAAAISQTRRGSAGCSSASCWAAGAIDMEGRGRTWCSSETLTGPIDSMPALKAIEHHKRNAMRTFDLPSLCTHGGSAGRPASRPGVARRGAHLQADDGDAPQEL